MKKLYALFFVFFILPASADIVNNFSGVCGNYKYDELYAQFTPISYTCNANMYLPANSTSCSACPTGFTCAGGTFDFNENIDQGLTPIQYTCNSGYFLPANSTTCAACPSGYTCSGGTFDFSRTEYSGLVRSSTYMAGNESNVCASNYGRRIYAVFTAIPYVCNSGYFLPAASTTCAACPSGYTCSGGTYYYHPTKSSGLVRTAEKYTTNETNACASNFNHNLIATFRINTHNCSSGQYLPANVDVCTTCPNGYVCSGGTYTFNETNDQGITACPTNHPYSPRGMWQESQCGRKLHVGNDVVYMHQSPANPTQHRLFIQYGNTNYSANANPKGAVVPKMSAGAERSLHMMIDGIEYIVHDDSVE